MDSYQAKYDMDRSRRNEHAPPNVAFRFLIQLCIDDVYRGGNPRWHGGKI
jgi:hypothetical protein